MRAQQRAGRRSAQTLPHRQEFVNGNDILAAVVANAWAVQDVAHALGADREHSIPATMRALSVVRPLRGAVVGFRPERSRISPHWRAQVESAGLTPVDPAVVGGEPAARRLTFNETLVRAAEYATCADLGAVVLVGITDFVDAVADACHRHRKLLVVADHARTGLWSYCGAADIVVELGAGCFPTRTGRVGA